MNDLGLYLKMVVEPTLDEFRRNPRSARHYYLAAIALFHCVDRVARLRGKKPRTVREEWGRKSNAFARVDVIAHDFKHVQASHRFNLAPLVPRAPGLLGTFALNTTAFNDTGQLVALARSISVFQEALKFIKLQGGILG